jgi:hypothetical protein
MALKKTIRRPAGAEQPLPRNSCWLLTNSGFVLTGNPEVISSPVGLVPTNALVSRDLVNFLVGYTRYKALIRFMTRVRSLLMVR